MFECGVKSDAGTDPARVSATPSPEEAEAIKYDGLMDTVIYTDQKLRRVRVRQVVEGWTCDGRWHAKRSARELRARRHM